VGAHDKAYGNMRKAEEEYYALRRAIPEGRLESDRNLRAALARKKSTDERSSDLWQKTHETRKDLAEGAREVSRHLIESHWSDLTVPERRIFDVVASDNKLYAGGVEDVIEGLLGGRRIEDEKDFVREKVEFKDGVLPDNSGYQYVYGGDTNSVKREYQPLVDQVVGGEVFALQRSMSLFIPEIIDAALSKIPEEYTICRQAVISYLTDVIGKCCAHVLDEDGVKLSLLSHINKPYSDDEWREGLAKQLEVAPHVARAILEEHDIVMAVTMYGPITRKSKNYRMFHPKTGLQLGACFYDASERAIDGVIRTAHEVGQHYGIEVKTGTGQGGVFGGAFYTWNYSTPRDTFEHLSILRSRKKHYMDDVYLNYLGEVYTQVEQGVPLAVRNERDFEDAKIYPQEFSREFFNPIFNRVAVLYNHFEKGYPYPIEYQGRYK